MIVKPTGDYSILDMKHAYIAGFFDGEGCIGVYIHDKRYSTIQTMIKLDNTNKTPLQFVANMFGGLIHERTIYSERHKPCYTWKVTGVKAASILKDLLPYLLVKRERAALGIECTFASKERRIEIFNKMCELNKRGAL